MLQFVTTIKDAAMEICDEAKLIAVQLNLPYLERSQIPLQRKLAEECVALVFEKNGPALHSVNGIHRFHLNLSGLRIINIERGLGDNMASAMQLSPGMRVLDCTLGLASDAIVASYCVGASGSVHGCERSVLLSYINKRGLAEFSSGKSELDTALRRITLTNIDYHDYLLTIADKSFDIIYFDPMFARPQQKSSAFSPIRTIVCDLPLTVDMLELAASKTAKRVVVKLEQYSKGQSCFDEIIGGKHSAVRYGVIYRR
ncbi:MAG: class I SAM-dependent methyltransferase [Bacillota bacterium]